MGQRAGGKVHRQHHAQGPAWGGLTSLSLGHMDGPMVCLFQWRIAGLFPNGESKFWQHGRTCWKPVSYGVKTTNIHQQYPAKDCLVFLRNHDSWQEMNWSLSDCLVVEAAIRTQGVHLFACPDC